MSDMYYKDTLRSVEKAEELDLSFLNEDYLLRIETLKNEAEGLAVQYSSLLDCNSQAQERIEELEGIVENLRELIEDNEE
tara:strand:- start:16237 stop:16476 length:240 start_codon:yes stop_codon:yes gene_type:complete